MATPDHIVVVIEENHDADQVIGNPNAPYINNTLVANGLYYDNAHGTDHPSQPNYLEMFAGVNPGNQGVNSPLQQHYPAGTENTPAGQNALAHGDDYNTGQPFSSPNLGAELLAAGKTFAGYSEDQPSVGFTGAQANGINGNRSYVEKHNAWAQFQGTGPNQLPASTNQPFTTFQSTTDFSNLPNVSFVVPNEYNDMHDTVSKLGLYADPTKGKDANGNSLDKYGNPVNDNATIQDGDTWLQNNLEAYRQWATTHNSLLITVWDENDYDFSNPNDIPMIIDGDPNLVQQGVNSSYVNHFDLLKTLEGDYGLAPTGLAATANGLSVNNSGKLVGDVVANNDVVTLAATQTAVSGNVLSNDSDVDGDKLTVTSVLDYSKGVPQKVAVPASGTASVTSNHGVFTIAADGSYTFTANDTRPAQGHYAEDPLVYTVSDGHGASASAQLQVNLAAQQRPSTETFNFNFVNTTVSYGSDGQAYLTGPDGVTHNVTGVGTLIFNDGRINGNNATSNLVGDLLLGRNGGALVDDLYYDSQYHDVYLSGMTPEAHYAQYGWHEGRNPDPYFNTNYYLNQNPDVKAAGIDPLTHYDQYGWKEGRNPSADFNTKDYELAYPDVAASGVDPLAQYLSTGELENRLTFPANAGAAGTGPIDGFDPTYYLANNPDVAASGMNPLQHYLQYGWKEGRNPSADFNTNFYEAQNPDVKAAGIDPLIHYDQYGWHEGRDPSAAFSTSGYLNAYVDVAAADINPLQHYLQYGMAEGRNPTG